MIVSPFIFFISVSSAIVNIYILCLNIVNKYALLRLIVYTELRFELQLMQNLRSRPRIWILVSLNLGLGKIECIVTLRPAPNALKSNVLKYY